MFADVMYIFFGMLNKKAIFMPSPINAILEGLYETNTTLADLKEHGDFGIGTFNDLDGEMVLVDGVTYRIDLDGNASIVEKEKTPFAAACFFTPVSVEHIDQPIDYQGFLDLLEICLPSKNMLYAIRVEGHFDRVKTRSVPRTQNHVPLVEVTAHQKVTDVEDVNGVLVGFYTPSFIPSVNVPGYHFHFITESRDRGGHLLSCEIDQATLSIQFYTQLDLHIPMTQDYLLAEFERDARADLEKAER